MLIDNKGKEYNPKNLPSNRKAREAVLANLREVKQFPRRGGKTHLLEARAKVVG